MTLDSITKGLLKAWKTSTGWAITILSIIILALSTITEVSLSGLATFGIFFIAMQALVFTKSQSKEWRRISIERACKENKEKYLESSSPIFKLFFQLHSTAGMKQRISHLTKFPREFSNTTTSLIYELEIINEHLLALNHDGIDDVIDIFNKSLAIPLFIERHDEGQIINEDSFERSCEEFISSFNFFKQSLRLRHGKGLPGEIPEMRFINYIKTIHKIGIARTD